ncbi:DUF6279 family lipoprotein [Shewanella sp. SNU WT4]|uniref:DUF6279 family lipoprotein n=1 Tax=Shewanella sp. SNU WT4 TaxID=2590015 RepID=UPI0023F33114|nr:DUF6279 family lipoprotein [Shewanella sp. SNU WT4]
MNIQAEIDEDKERYLNNSDDEWVHRNDKSMLDKAKEYLGALSAEQRIMILQYNRSRPRTTKLWYSYQAVWFKRFMHALQLRQDKEYLRQELAVLLTATDTLKSAQYQELITANSQALARLVAALQTSLSAKQQQKIMATMTQLAADLDELSADGLNNIASHPQP